MSRRSSKKKKTAAKVHRITKRHHREAELMYYSRELDKIYTKIEMANMVPQVVQKMRREFADNPVELYLLVCNKYGITPQKYDVDMFVYGRGKHKKHKLEQDADKERVGGRKELGSEKKNEETIEETSDKPKEKVEEVTDNKETKEEDAEKPVAEIEEKNEELPELEQKVEAEPAPQFERESDIEIVAQSPRRAKVVERMYQTPAANQSASQEKAVDERKMSPRTSSQAEYQQRTSPRAGTQNMIEYVNIYPGDICETMVLTQSDNDAETGFWIPAQVITIDTERERMDLEVLQPVKYGLSKMARNVPYRYVRAPSEITFEY